MSEFKMPALGADMQFGTVVSWRVKSGDQVKRGDVVALVETEKGVVEVEIFESGVIESLVVPPGQKVPVGSTLAILRGDGAPAVPTEAARATAEKPAAPTEEQRPAIAPAVVVEDQPAKRSAPHIFPVPEAGVRARFSPLARKRAAELGVELTAIAGTGEGGAVQVADVERAAAKVTDVTTDAAPPQSKGLDLTSMREFLPGVAFWIS